MTDPAGAVAGWSAAVLKVPPGHPRAGEPMTLPPYAVSWLREALAPATRESLLCLARKNAKSAVLCGVGACVRVRAAVASRVSWCRGVDQRGESW